MIRTTKGPSNNRGGSIQQGYGHSDFCCMEYPLQHCQPQELKVAYPLHNRLNVLHSTRLRYRLTVLLLDSFHFSLRLLIFPLLIKAYRHISQTVLLAKSTHHPTTTGSLKLTEDRYQTLLGCSSVDLSNATAYYARYTTSVICNAIVQNSITPCGLTGDATTPLCADSCVSHPNYPPCVAVY